MAAIAQKIRAVFRVDVTQSALPLRAVARIIALHDVLFAVNRVEQFRRITLHAGNLACIGGHVPTVAATIRALGSQALKFAGYDILLDGITHEKTLIPQEPEA